MSNLHSSCGWVHLLAFGRNQDYYGLWLKCSLFCCRYLSSLSDSINPCGPNDLVWYPAPCRRWNKKTQHISVGSRETREHACRKFNKSFSSPWQTQMRWQDVANCALIQGLRFTLWKSKQGNISSVSWPDSGRWLCATLYWHPEEIESYTTNTPYSTKHQPLCTSMATSQAKQGWWWCIESAVPCMCMKLQ